MNRFFLTALTIFCLIFSIACSGESDAGSVGDFYTFEIAGQRLELEVSVTQIEHRKGLMFRESLPENHGMLFVFQKPTRLRFWMKNTSIPLDIAYLDEDGVLCEIYPLNPRTITAVESRRLDLQFALEVNRGWFERNGIKVGDQLEPALIAKVLRERDFAPSLFGLHE